MKIINIDKNTCPFCKLKIYNKDQYHYDCNDCKTQVDVCYHDNQCYIEWLLINDVCDLYNIFILDILNNNITIYKFNKFSDNFDIPENFELSMTYIEHLFRRYEKLKCIS